jgi:hypothetical protein
MILEIVPDPAPVKVVVPEVGRARVPEIVGVPVRATEELFCNVIGTEIEVPKANAVPVLVSVKIPVAPVFDTDPLVKVRDDTL